MDKKTEMQTAMLVALEQYMKNTPSNVLLEEVKKISEMNFVGTTAEEYFKNFNQYHSPEAYNAYHIVYNNYQHQATANLIRKKTKSSPLLEKISAFFTFFSEKEPFNNQHKDNLGNVFTSFSLSK